MKSDPSIKLSVKSKNDENDPFNKLQNPKTYLEPSRTTAMELFCKIVNGYFLQRAPSYMFDWVLKKTSGTIILSSHRSKVLLVRYRRKEHFSCSKRTLNKNSLDRTTFEKYQQNGVRRTFFFF